MKSAIIAQDTALVQQLKGCLGQVHHVRHCEIYSDLYQGLIYIINELPDIVFIDVDQYGKAALELADNIKKNYAAVAVAFIAADERYVVEGFEMGIVKYIMKPVENRQVISAMEKLDRKKRPQKRVQIRTMSHFDVYIDGDLIYFSNSKAKELLALLVDRRGTVSMETAISVLWENHCYDQNVKQLYRKAISYLRRLFDSYHVDIFVANRGSCYVRINDFDCDYYQLLLGDEEVIEQFDGAYMFEYPWAEATLVQIEKRLSNGSHTQHWTVSAANAVYD